MIKKRKFKRISSFCIAIILGLILCSCGGAKGSGSTAASETGKGEENASVSAPEEQEMQTEPAPGGDASEEAAAPEETASAAEEETKPEESAPPQIGYDAEGITVNVSGAEDYYGWFTIQCDIGNNGENNVGVYIFPLLLNDTISISEGVYEDLAAGDEVHSEIGFNMEKLSFLGISEIRSIQGYLTIYDEHYEPVIRSEPFYLLFDETVQDTAAVTHSDDVIYDKDGVTMSFLGSFRGENSGCLTAVFLISNNTTEVLDVRLDNENSLIDGKKPRGRYIASEDATVPVGEQALATVCVLNDETYEDAPFETADAGISIYSDNRDREQIPIHLTAEGDTVLCTADEPHPYVYSPAMECEVVHYGSDSAYEEYMSLYHERHSDIIIGIADELKLHKSAGYTKENVSGVDLNQWKPGLGDLDFISTMVEEDEEDVSFILLLSELDDASHLRQLHDIGYFSFPDPENTLFLSLEQTLSEYEKNDMEMVDPEEYESLGLHTDLFGS